MQKKRRIPLVLLFCCIFFSNSIANDIKRDSLPNKIEQSRGESKLQLMKKYALQQENKEITAKKTARDLINEAQKQNRIEYLTYGYEILSRTYANERNIDSLMYCISILDDLGDEYQSGDPYMYLTHLYISKGYYDMAIHNLKIMQKQATKHKHLYKGININMLFSHAYSSSGRLDLGEEYAIKSMKLLREIAPDQAPNRVIGIYENAIGALASNKKYEEALKVCSDFEHLIEKHSTDTEQYEDCRYLLYFQYAMLYIDLQNSEKAKFYIDKMKGLPTDDIKTTAIPLIDIALSSYNSLTENYNVALEHLETAKAYYNKIGIPGMASNLTENQLKIFEKQNRYKEALTLYKQLSSRRDSIYKENVPLQIEKLTAGFELEKSKIQQEKDKAELKNKQILIIGLVMLLFLICFILFILKINNQKLKEKNKVLFKQNKEANRLAMLAKEVLALDEIAPEQEISAFDKIQTYMQEKEPFKNPNITREDLAKELNTNRQYLTEDIKAATGKTFLDYINGYRLHYAHQLLVKDDSIPISSIMFDSGFSSTSTFYRLFKEEFGMSPGELRQIKKELERKESEIDEDNDQELSV